MKRPQFKSIIVTIDQLINDIKEINEKCKRPFSELTFVHSLDFAEVYTYIFSPQNELYNYYVIRCLLDDLLKNKDNEYITLLPPVIIEALHFFTVRFGTLLSRYKIGELTIKEFIKEKGLDKLISIYKARRVPKEYIKIYTALRAFEQIIKITRYAGYRYKNILRPLYILREIRYHSNYLNIDDYLDEILKKEEGDILNERVKIIENTLDNIREKTINNHVDATNIVLMQMYDKNQKDERGTLITRSLILNVRLVEELARSGQTEYSIGVVKYPLYIIFKDIVEKAATSNEKKIRILNITKKFITYTFYREDIEKLREKLYNAYLAGDYETIIQFLEYVYLYSHYYDDILRRKLKIILSSDYNIEEEVAKKIREYIKEEVGSLRDCPWNRRLTSTELKRLIDEIEEYEDKILKTQREIRLEIYKLYKVYYDIIESFVPYMKNLKLYNMYLHVISNI